jgi:hypothetical protein
MVHGIMLAIIISKAPELLEKKFADGSTCHTSNSFVQKWLHEEMHWSKRKATQAAQHLPENWEDICERSFFRDVYIIKEEDIPAIYLSTPTRLRVSLHPETKLHTLLQVQNKFRFREKTRNGHSLYLYLLQAMEQSCPCKPYTVARRITQVHLQIHRITKIYWRWDS